MPISRDISRRAAAQPGRLALDGACGPVTYGQLAARVTARAEQLSDSGVGQADRVVVTEADPTATVADIVAADSVGAAAVVTDPGWSDQVRDAAVKAATDIARPYGSTVALVVFTSGSTGIPKPVARTRRSWTTSFPTFSALTGIGAQDRVLIPGPLSSSLFLFGALHALTMGGTVHALDRWSAAAAAAACRGESGCSAVHLVPAMLADLLDRIGPGDSSLRVAVCGGARLDPAPADLRPPAGLEVVDYYGSAELSVAAIRRPDGRMTAFPGVQVVVEDGVIWARGPYVALGVTRGPDGYATAGDHGTLDPSGHLTVHGRGSAAVSTGGATVHAEGVEDALRRLPSIREVAVVGTPHDRLGEVVTAVVEPHPDETPTLAQLREAAGLLQATERPRRWHLVRRLPRTTAGKVDRSLVVTALAEGTLPTLAVR